MNINIYNFENYVDARVTERGKQYLNDGSVLEIEEVGNREYSAVVLGSEHYTVNISLSENNDLYTHQCDCPYDFGPFCKHKVAVLLKLKLHLKEAIPFEQGNLGEIKKVLSTYKKEEIQQFVIELARSNYRIKRKILRQMGIPFDKDEKDYFY